MDTQRGTYAPSSSLRFLTRPFCRLCWPLCGGVGDAGFDSFRTVLPDFQQHEFIVLSRLTCKLVTEDFAVLPIKAFDVALLCLLVTDSIDEYVYFAH